MKNTRAIAAQRLVDVLNGHSLTTALLTIPAALSAQDKSLVRQLCFGVLRYYFSLQAIMNHFLTKPLAKKDDDVRALILVGLYQLVYLRVPHHASVNETTTGALAIKKPWARGLINAILRGFLREPEIAERDTSEEVIYNHPQWMINQLRADYPEDWQSICSANNQQAPMTLRINVLQTTRENYLAYLAEKQISATPSAHSVFGVHLMTPLDVQALPGFLEGKVSVQDESAQQVASLLDLQPQLRVLDACAAPGGKLCHMLELQPLLKDVVALDKDEQRCAKITQNVSRLQLSAHIKTADALALPTWWDGQLFDRILIDAPCSGSGVIRRHPDSKLLRREEDITSLALQQAELLKALWPVLAENGLLLYATCSVFHTENDAVIAGFLTQHHDARSVDIQLTQGRATPFGWQCLPQAQGGDGFYYAILRKIK